MTVVRRTAAVAAAVALAALVPGVPALAHGATGEPVSRTAACAGAGDGSTACAAARRANGRPFGAFDNLRVPGVAGADRTTIPDGRLCSGGLPEFAGLDLARTDWPATRLPADGTLRLRYRATIPHAGTFRVYLTRAGYDPREPLAWADLGSRPLLTATDPPLRDGVYRMSATLPAGRTGRHVLYVVWQTSSTPDTYYSCSDLILTAPAAGSAAPAAGPGAPAAGSAGPAAGSASPGAGPAAPAASARSSRSAELSRGRVSHSSAPAAPVPPARSGAAAGAAGRPGPGGAAGGSPGGAAGGSAADRVWLTTAGDEQQVTRGQQVVSGALVVLVGVTATMALLRIRRARAARRPRRFNAR